MTSKSTRRSSSTTPVSAPVLAPVLAPVSAPVSALIQFERALGAGVMTGLAGLGVALHVPKPGGAWLALGLGAGVLVIALVGQATQRLTLPARTTDVAVVVTLIAGAAALLGASAPIAAGASLVAGLASAAAPRGIVTGASREGARRASPPG